MASPTIQSASKETAKKRGGVFHDFSWSEEQIYEDNNDFFDAFITSIDQAKSNIILVTYIFEYDALGKHVLDRLIAAKDRGVNIRVIFDGFGSFETGNKVARVLEENTIPIKIFHPLPWQTENYHRALYQSSWLGSFLSFVLKINKRLHAKVCIVDNEQLWCGSQNICLDHLTTDRSGASWHDLGAAVTGQGVNAVAEGFNDLWETQRPRLGEGKFKYHWNNITTIARQQKNKQLAEKLGNAKEKIWIVNPYFSPPRRIIKSIKNAANHGADVRIIVPAKSDISFFPLLTATYYGELLANNIRIFEYEPTILHKKVSVIDDFILLGSTNYNHRSVIHDIEFDIVVDSSHAAHVIEKSFLKDQANSREITRERFEQQGTRRMLGWIPRLLRYWL